MKNRDVVAGVVLVALIAAGVYLARSRSAPADAPTDRPAAAKAPLPVGDESLPDATLTDAVVDTDGIRLTLSLDPRPPEALAKMRVRVRAESDGAPAALENGRVSFEMVMPMGEHHYTFVAGADGWQEADVVLPT